MRLFSRWGELIDPAARRLLDATGWAAPDDDGIPDRPSVYPHGVAELSHPEPNVFLVGMKSYGRAPTFLAMTGYEQVRSIAAALAGTMPPPPASNSRCRRPGYAAAPGSSTNLNPRRWRHHLLTCLILLRVRPTRGWFV